MIELSITNDDFKLFKKFPAIPRIIIGSLLGIIGLMAQIFLPIRGTFPFEITEFSPVSFFIGLGLIIGALLLLFPERIVLSEEPVLIEEKPFWKDTSMQHLSDFFNLLNNREKKKKSIASIFDLKKSKGRWIFFATTFGITLIYILALGLSSRLSFSTIIFLIDFYLLIIPLWFVIKIEYWEPEILRKILFYYQFQQQDELNDIEFITTPAVQIQRIKEEESTEELMLPLNVRFMIDFENEPTYYDSLACQIILNEKMGNKFPSFICFLRIRKPADWMPLKKEIAYADRIVKINHIQEEDNIHLFVLSKSQKVDDPEHTSPREASIIFKRAYKMMMDFGK